MWLTTSFGFYSIIQKQGHPCLTIRARVAADLDELRKRYLPDLSPTIREQGTDYPYCATISHERFAGGLARMGAEIHYSDFKEILYEEQGQERGYIFSEAWSVLHRLEAQNDAPPRERPAPGRRLAYGGVVMDSDGRVLLREPFNHRGGHAWTFPKDEPQRGESMEQTALRAVADKGGVHARIIEQIPGIFSGDTTNTGYYLMMFAGKNGKDGFHSKSIIWVTREEAETHIKMSSSVMGRARDLEVLSNAYSLYSLRFRAGKMAQNEIDSIEGRILACAALRFDGYHYMDRNGVDGSALMEAYLATGDLAASPLDQLCIFFLLQRRLMKWKAGTPKNTDAWQAFRKLFLATCGFRIPTEYRHPEYCDRWTSEFLPKINECVALVQVIHAGTNYPFG